MSISVSGSQITFNDASIQNTAATGFGFKNRIINGAMMIDQRNAGASVNATGAYTIDRWYAASAGGTTTIQRIASGLTGFTNAIQIKQLTGVTLSTFVQRIESNNCQDLASINVTISGQLYIDNASGVTCNLYVGIPTAADNYASVNYLTPQTIALTGGSYVSFSKTYTLTSSAPNGLEINFQFSGAVGKTIQLTGVQLEKGSTATSFDYRPYGTELQLCQRYYEVITITPSTATLAAGQYSASYFTSTWQFKVNKRAAPTYTVGAGGYSGATPSSYAQIDNIYLSAASAFYLNGTSGNIAASASAEL